MNPYQIINLESQVNRMGDQIKLLTAELAELQAARTKEQNEVYELVQDLFVARWNDGENGVKWLNEAKAAQWLKDNPELHKAMQALSCRIEAWVMEDEDEEEPT